MLQNFGGDPAVCFHSVRDPGSGLAASRLKPIYGHPGCYLQDCMR